MNGVGWMQGWTQGPGGWLQRAVVIKTSLVCWPQLILIRIESTGCYNETQLRKTILPPGIKLSRKRGNTIGFNACPHRCNMQSLQVCN